MIKITDSQNRGILSEGRNYQMGFAFCKKVTDKKFETVQPISPCKDYLNDVVYSEHTGKKITACGLKYEKTGIFGDNAYLAFKIQPRQNDKGYEIKQTNGVREYNKDKENLSKNYKNIQTLLNYVEEGLKVEKTKVVKGSDGTFLAKADKFWTSKIYLTSLYSLLIRMGQFYDGKKSPKEFLDSYNDSLDLGLWQNAKIKVEKMLGGHLPEQPFDTFKTHSDVHFNSGIVATKFD